MTTTNTDRRPEAVSDDQIRLLRADAVAAGDYAQADICDRALVADDATTDQDGNPIACSDWTQADARASCAAVIGYAAARAREG